MIMSVQTVRLKKVSFSVAMVIAATCMALSIAQAASTGPQVLKNPYENIDWGAVNQYVANLHGHTLYSDGRAEPDTLIYNYAEAGYHILAITDHDNYHTTREEERETAPTASTTWPWTNWIVERPSPIWQRGGIETAAFFPELGEQGMLAIRGNELSSHPHLVSLFNDCGFQDRSQTEEDRMACIEAKEGLAYWAHPANYVPEGGWEDRFFDISWDEAIEYYGRYIADHDYLLGFEMQLGNRRALEEEFFARLLGQYYRDHDIFIMGSDDTHSTSVSENAPITLVLAEALTEESVRQALEQGHSFVGARSDIYPQVNGITVNETARSITVDADNHDGVAWFVNGEKITEGSSFDYSEMEDAVVQFRLYVGSAIFYSQAFFID